MAIDLAETLAQAFVSALAKRNVALPRDRAKLGGGLAQAVARAHHAWPDIHVDAREFVAFLADKAEGASDLEAALAELRCADLLLAFGCLKGDGRALQELDRRYLSKVPAALARMHLDAASIDDVVQSLRQKLLVAVRGGVPKIAQYAGRGSLDAWLAAASVRIAIDLERAAEPRQAGEDELLADLPSPQVDPEMECIRARHEPEFRKAFQDALAALSDQDRTVLRLSFLDRLSIDQIGEVFRVHRSTAARWIARCREEVFDKTRQLLRERLRMTDREFESLVGALRSNLDVSIHRLLGRSQPR
ncbi:MAG: sigma-70 family RNA polymerase sigma factor [Deltaproteobacteria bacterium]|nr:sigma-70 family RNA polymerase sigma factor [Deltaproteobacteria bacterium]